MPIASRGLTLVLFTGVAGILLDASPASACLCDTQCSSLLKADAIFEATVTSIALAPDEPSTPEAFVALDKHVSLRDVRGWRGETPAIVITPADGYRCGYPFQESRRYLMVAYRQSDGRLRVSKCSLTSPIEAAQRLLAYLETLHSPPQGGQLWGGVWRPMPITPSRPPYAVPLPNVRVVVSGPRNISVTTNADGEYFIAGLPPGEYTVRADLNDVDLARPTPRTVDLERADACAIVDFRPHWRTRVMGRVINADGSPAVRVGVYLIKPWQPPNVGLRAWTDAAGNYEFWDVPVGRYVIATNVSRGPEFFFVGPGVVRLDPIVITRGR